MSEENLPQEEVVDRPFDIWGNTDSFPLDPETTALITEVTEGLARLEGKGGNAAEARWDLTHKVHEHLWDIWRKQRSLIEEANRNGWYLGLSPAERKTKSDPINHIGRNLAEIEKFFNSIKR